MADRNDTLFNNCPGNRPPNWDDFDALEIDCCASGLMSDGSTWAERAPLYEAEFFTVFGHLKKGGCEAITDVSTRKLAHQIASVFKNRIGADCMILDCCGSDLGCLETH
jgi:hypothetical protein